MLTSAEIDLIAAAMEKRLEPRFEAMDQRFEAVDRQIGQVVELINSWSPG
jgi:hypothetical protein